MIDDARFVEILQKCPNLESLSLCGCCELTDESFQMIGEFCPDLQYLDLSNHKESLGSGIWMSPDVFSGILEKCKKLLYLNLFRCHIVKDEILRIIADKCPLILDLNISECNISNAGLKAIGDRCKKLQSINIKFCFRISNEGFIAISTLPCLRSLNIQECSQISHEIVQAFQRERPEVKWICDAFDDPFDSPIPVDRKFYPAIADPAKA